MTRLSMFSTDHASSPITLAPTIRPLPFNVWNERRTSVRAVSSPRSASHCGSHSLMVSITSPTSSAKISTMSSSTATTGRAFAATGSARMGSACAGSRWASLPPCGVVGAGAGFLDGSSAAVPLSGAAGASAVTSSNTPLPRSKVSSSTSSTLMGATGCISSSALSSRTRRNRCIGIWSVSDRAASTVSSSSSASSSHGSTSSV